MEKVEFRNHIYWYEWPSESRNEFLLRRKLLKLAPYEIVVSSDNKKSLDLRDIGELTEGKWSAFSSWDDAAHYFFELESDALAFKLKFL